MTREENKAIIFASLKPLFDACLELPYDEDRDAYHIIDDDLWIRADGRIYDSNFFVQDGYTVQQFIKEQLAPRVKEDIDNECCSGGFHVEFESFEDGQPINVLSGVYYINEKGTKSTFTPITSPLKCGKYILTNRGNNQWLALEDRIHFSVENGKIKLSK